MTNFIKTSLLYLMLASFSCAALNSAPQESMTITPSSVITEKTLIPHIIEIDKKASRLFKKKSFLQKQLGNTWINHVPFLASWYKKNRQNQENQNSYRPCLNAIELITYKKIITHIKNCNLNDFDADFAEDQSENENRLNQQLIESIKYLFYYQDNDKQFPFRASLTHLFLQTIGLSNTKKSEEAKEKIIAKEILGSIKTIMSATTNYNHEIKNIIDQHVTRVSQYFQTLDLHNQSIWSTKKITKVALATLATAATGYGIHQTGFFATLKTYFSAPANVPPASPPVIPAPIPAPAALLPPAAVIINHMPAVPALVPAPEVLTPPPVQPEPSKDLELFRHLFHSARPDGDIVELGEDGTEVPLKPAKPISKRLEELPKQLQEQGEVILKAFPEWINRNAITPFELLALLPTFAEDTLLNQILVLHRNYSVLFAREMQALKVANKAICFLPTLFCAPLNALMTEPVTNPDIMIPLTHGTQSIYEIRAQDPVLRAIHNILRNMNPTAPFTGVLDPQMISPDIIRLLEAASIIGLLPLFLGYSLGNEFIKQCIQVGALKLGIPRPVSAISICGLNCIHNVALLKQFNFPQGPSLPLIPLSTMPVLLTAARHLAPNTTASLVNTGAEITHHIPEQAQSIIRDLVKYGFQGYMLKQGLQNLSSVDSRIPYVIAAILVAHQYIQEHPHHTLPESLKQKCIALYEEIPQRIRDTFTNIQRKMSNIPFINQITPTTLSNTTMVARFIPSLLQPSTAPGTLIASGITVGSGLVLYNKAENSNLANKEEIKVAVNDTVKGVIKFFVTIYMLHMIMYYSTVIGF